MNNSLLIEKHGDNLPVYLPYIEKNMEAVLKRRNITRTLRTFSSVTWTTADRRWFGWVLWHITPSRLFKAKSSLYIY